MKLAGGPHASGTNRFVQRQISRNMGCSPRPFAKAMLDEAVAAFLNGEPHVARMILRDLVNASVGLEELASGTKRSGKCLPRMLSEKRNPRIDNLAAIFGAVRKRLGVAFEVHAVEAA